MYVYLYVRKGERKRERESPVSLDYIPRRKRFGVLRSRRRMFPKSTDMYGNVERRDICRQDILRVSRFQRMATEIMTFQENKIEKVGNLRLRQKYEFTIKKNAWK